MLIWDEQYSVANEMIDAQHQSLFKLVNKCNTASIQTLNATILELYKYTRIHFHDEEAYMKSIDYPKLKQHRQLHNEIIEALNAIASKKIESDADAEAFIEFITDWLTDHILKHDMAITKV